MQETSIINKKVNFLIVGAQKAGTSILHYFLKLHPEILTATKKEVHFFDDNDNFIKEPVDYNKYHSYFDNKNSAKAIGEITPSYMFNEPCVERIYAYNPKMKIIVLLRNPTERAFSAWKMNNDKFNVDRSFFDLIKKEFDIISGKIPQKTNSPAYAKRGLIKPNYIRRGLYVNQIERIWKFFPKEQVMILKNESLRNDHEKTLEEIFRFLKVDPHFKIKQKIKKTSPNTSPMDTESKNFLLTIFKPEIKRLEQVLNWDCSDWLK